MLLKYGFAYLNNQSGSLEKHIMRYPQFFASKAIRKTFDNNIRKGIIWHTQGSGKTALAFYNVRYLTDYFRKKKITPKFYFIVDRLDLLTQASGEFISRGLVVHHINSREDFKKDIRKSSVINNPGGKSEITVVNIQRFAEDKDFLREKDYDLNIQRIYFLDEVHRSYNPNGSMLANLFASDRNAILIGLTGTPLILKDKYSRDTFGDYIHKYYYNDSIADGYTLKLIREEIETKYKMILEEALKNINVIEKNIKTEQVFAHPRFVEPMLEYIVEDFRNSRIRFGDNSIGAMVICSSSAQAKKMFEIFENKYTLGAMGNITASDMNYPKVANHGNKLPLSARLILHDVNDTVMRKKDVEDFKDGKIDFLIVYNMLLTGFDAHRLKKLYLNRQIDKHNLLQALTRVNRPYKDFRYGFVVDFADISSNFDATNKAYLEELQRELGTDMDKYSNLLKSKEDIESEINEISEKLFTYDLKNAEIFSRQISEINDRKVVLEITKTLENAKNLYNVIRLTGNYEILDKFDFRQFKYLYNAASDHLALLNFRESVKNKDDSANLLNEALENVLFMFKKISEDELTIAESLKNILKKVRESLAANFDKKDPRYVTLYDELKRLFNNRNLEEITQDEMNQNIKDLEKIHGSAVTLNQNNDRLKSKYEYDEKYARVHKRILEYGSIVGKESLLQSTLLEIKKDADSTIMNRQKILENESFFTNLMMNLVIDKFQRASINLDPDSADFINNCISKEYLNEYNGVNSW